MKCDRNSLTKNYENELEGEVQPCGSFLTSSKSCHEVSGTLGSHSNWSDTDRPNLMLEKVLKGFFPELVSAVSQPLRHSDSLAR